MISAIAKLVPCAAGEASDTATLISFEIGSPVMSRPRRFGPVTLHRGPDVFSEGRVECGQLWCRGAVRRELGAQLEALLAERFGQRRDLGCMFLGRAWLWRRRGHGLEVVAAHEWHSP